MGYMQLRGHYWYYYYIDPETKKKTGEPTEFTKAYTKKQLETYKNDRDKEIRCRKLGISNLDKTFDALVEDFYRTSRAANKAPATLKAYEHAFKVFKANHPHLGKVKDATDKVIENFIIQRIKAKVSARTIESEMERIRALFNYAVSKGIISVSPCKGVQTPKIPPRLPKYCTIDQCQKVYRVACTYQEDCWRDAVFIAPRTSMRPQEVRNLRWDTVDLVAREIVNYNQKTNIITKIPINDSLFNHLSEMKSRVKGEYLIAYNDGRRPDAGTFCKIMRDIFNKAGLPHFSFNTLRHTAATKILQSGKFELSEIGKLMGHKKTSTTQIYAHVLDERMKAMADELDFE